ncbi:BTAD domain-containing putative transcriptional regulator [Actinophytocola xanthii]|uniref:SARP family transcriptional regulator n=1 Tax=Actinophytocola xanthii TaxID=1912961 RepID=A0A1Q8C1I7_9PSEU|nr:BTAD domain-containing putative transcriptional regulator [Actinophytocola xanthii]OLF08224.1 SARP family transcriptional regulator [Actinophytocola xanthii]
MVSSVRFGVLGPLVAQDAGAALDLRGPRHRAVLARLLVARGRVVPVDRLVADLWEDPPEGAVGALQTFVAALRRALEPDRPPRAPARLLVTSGPGYALRAADDGVDAWRFEVAVAGCGESLAAHRAEEALTAAETALGLWRGPAYAEFDDQPWARAEIARLDELRLLALERRAAALLDLGRAAEAVPDLEAHARAHPWREEAWRLLALALYRSDRQGDALAALRQARRRLADELGVDPGQALRTLEADILAQAPHLAAPAPGPAPVPGSGPARRALVGRDAELAQLLAAAENGRGLALVSGDAGAGKTALAESFAAHLATRGWTTAWGASPDTEGLPPAWPWSQVLAELPPALTDQAVSAHGPASTGPAAPTDGADPLVARFHRHRAVAAQLAVVARQAPLLVVLDDLHRAGDETLALLASVVGERVPGVLVVGTHRATDLSASLSELLGRVARLDPVRVYLGGLEPDAVAELVRETTGRPPDAATAAAVRRRSGGNPFFVRELARLVEAEGPAGLVRVPPGVRDVVRLRVAGLPDPARQVLRQAAVTGTELDLELHADLAGHDVLDAVEVAVRHGFLVEYGPHRFRFAHALVRDTVYEEVPPTRRARAHAAVADAIERLRPADVEALAHHLLLAEGPGTAARAARHAREAAERAERRFAPHEAARLWSAALTAHEAAGAEDSRERLALLAGLVRTLALTGGLDRARRYRAEAVGLAEAVGDPELTARVITGFDVPAIWTDNDDPELGRRIALVAEQTLAALPGPTARRARLLATIALELRSAGGQRARAAAEEAEAIARELGEPALLAFALNARFMVSFERAGLAGERARIGAELVELATRHGLVTFEVLGHLVLVQANAALADLAAADRHAAAADQLGERYQIPLVGVFTQWYRALRSAVTGSRAEAVAAYRSAAARLPGTGMSGMDNGLLELALLTVDESEVDNATSFGAYESWCRPVLLLAENRVDEARALTIPNSPRDLLFEARSCLHATVAVRLGDRSAMERLYAELLPAAAELAGAGSGLLSLGPVARHLGDLAVALGRPDRAAEHYRQARAVAERAGAAAGVSGGGARS